jgi:hypothetical protein
MKFLVMVLLAHRRADVSISCYYVAPYTHMVQLE